MLKTGYTPDLRFVGSSMADVVVNTASLSDSDRGRHCGLHQILAGTADAAAVVIP